MTSEGFWRQCFHLLPVERKAEILFDFPYRGQWFPTWLDWPARDPEYDHPEFARFNEEYSRRHVLPC